MGKRKLRSSLPVHTTRTIRSTLHSVRSDPLLPTSLRHLLSPGQLCSYQTYEWNALDPNPFAVLGKVTMP